jgi:hypothetical protein
MSSLGEVTKAQAAARGRVLAKALGPGWKVTTWQNFGWHFQVVKGGIKVSENRYNGKVSSYTAYINKIGELGGKWAETAETPQMAIRVTLIKAEQEIVDAERIFRGAMWEAMIQ